MVTGNGREFLGRDPGPGAPLRFPERPAPRPRNVHREPPARRVRRLPREPAHGRRALPPRPRRQHDAHGQAPRRPAHPQAEEGERRRRSLRFQYTLQTFGALALLVTLAFTLVHLRQARSVVDEMLAQARSGAKTLSGPSHDVLARPEPMSPDQTMLNQSIYATMKAHPEYALAARARRHGPRLGIRTSSRSVHEPPRSEGGGHPPTGTLAPSTSRCSSGGDAAAARPSAGSRSPCASPRSESGSSGRASSSRASPSSRCSPGAS